VSKPSDLEFADVPCENCKAPQKEHYWVKLAEWIDHPGMPDAWLVCPTATWKQAPPENK